MMKAVFAVVLKRYWSLIASIVMISAFSQYLHEHQVSLVTILLSLAAGILALLVTAVPLEFHKLRKSR
jgi:hypothetical protein